MVFLHLVQRNKILLVYSCRWNSVYSTPGKRTDFLLAVTPFWEHYSRHSLTTLIVCTNIVEVSLLGLTLIRHSKCASQSCF